MLAARRYVATALSVLALSWGVFANPSVGLSKEFEIDGTVDCGTRSGRDCPPIGDTLFLYTDDVTGERARIAVDISWIRNQLPGLDQDDRIILRVEDRPDGKLQAVAVVKAEGLSGTMNPGLSTGSKEVPEQPKPKREDDVANSAGSPTPPTCFGREATITGAGEIIGTDGDDVIIGSDGPDLIVAGPGNDVICSLGGDDFVFAGHGDDLIDGGDGDDRLQDVFGDDVIFGGNGNDQIIAGFGDDTVDGGPGDDCIEGNPGEDEIDGGPGDDCIDGGLGSDEIDGGAGDDDIFGGLGPFRDVIHGGPGNDDIDGGPGNDDLDGGPDDDDLIGGAGTDTCDGGTGTDTATTCESVSNVP